MFTTKGFGHYLKKHRLEVLRETLREFSRRTGRDAGNLSRVERSKVLPAVPMAGALLRLYHTPIYHDGLRRKAWNAYWVLKMQETASLLREHAPEGFQILRA